MARATAGGGAVCEGDGHASCEIDGRVLGGMQVEVLVCDAGGGAVLRDGRHAIWGAGGGAVLSD